VNLEQQKLVEEHAALLQEILQYQEILADEARIRQILRDELMEIKRKYADERRTEITGEEIGPVDLEDLIPEETMVVSISHRGYIKRTPISVYRAQRRGGKGLKGAETEEEDPIEHLFVASTHAYLLFFTNRGKVYWQKVYDLPELKRDSRGRAIVNLLQLAEGERVAACLAVRDFTQEGQFLVMATRNGLVKKTPLEQYSRPRRMGIIAVHLKEGDELVAARVANADDEIILASAQGQAVRFRLSTVRSSGRDAQGVRGIKLRPGDWCVGMVVADPDATLLTVCQNGYGKRTPIGPNSLQAEAEEEGADDDGGEAALPAAAGSSSTDGHDAAAGETEEADEGGDSASYRYPTKGRGTMGVRDIKTTPRNGPVVAIEVVRDSDELLLMTAQGKIQRIRASDINVIGRNTQGVRLMSLEEGDSVAAVVRVAPEEAEPASPPPPALPAAEEEGGGSTSGS
jgi:DNA gyrase subunit A